MPSLPGCVTVILHEWLTICFSILNLSYRNSAVTWEVWKQKRLPLSRSWRLCEGLGLSDKVKSRIPTTHQDLGTLLPATALGIHMASSSKCWFCRLERFFAWRLSNARKHLFVYSWLCCWHTRRQSREQLENLIITNAFFFSCYNSHHC